MIYIVAIIHVWFIEDRYHPKQQYIPSNDSNSDGDRYVSPVEEMKKYEDMYAQGMITQEEYESKKSSLWDKVYVGAAC